MIEGLLGKKLGMTQLFKETGEACPATVIEAGPCVVLQLKKAHSNEYTSVQLGFDSMKESVMNRPEIGKFKKIGVNPTRFIKEIRVDDTEGLKPADKITVDIFTVGDYVDLTGTSIGKGFQGGIKRWHWKGGPKAHGSMSHRAPGSIGSTDAARVLKGHHLPGQMGNRKVTVQNLEVVEIDKENNLIVVKGGVPGAKGSYLIIKKTLKKRRREPKSPAVKEDRKVKKPKA